MNGSNFAGDSIRSPLERALPGLVLGARSTLTPGPARKSLLAFDLENPQEIRHSTQHVSMPQVQPAGWSPGAGYWSYPYSSQLSATVPQQSSPLFDVHTEVYPSSSSENDNAVKPVKSIATSCSGVPCRRCPQPAKTGYALWVGNLPTKATLHDLCWLFGTPEILSVYLIHRTSCAFVNYASDAGLAEAERAFYRRGGHICEQKLVIKPQREPLIEAKPNLERTSAPWSQDRYFICKSLLLSDIKAARKSCQWSTQIHNREKLNEAFYRSRNTYLIFSANRNSAFYGFARMVTPFPEEESTPDLAADEGSSGDEDIGLVVHQTPAFDNVLDGLGVPSGRTVHDTTRGCLFWEADGCPHESAEPEGWTLPCDIEWLSVESTQVPFTRTKHLRNPLNLDKPVKIARDGTELEPDVGRQLCALFPQRQAR